MCFDEPQDRMAAVAQMGRPLTETVRVKNTFIDGFGDDEEGDMPPMAQAKTCPAKACEHRTLLTAPLLQGAQAAVPAPVKTPAPPLRQRWVDVSDSEDEEGAGLVRMRSRRSSGGCATWSLAAEEPKEMETVIIEPLESRQPSGSRGALLHLAGACRPCAWYWKAQGCHLGHKCLHCHMCHKGEIKARKKNMKNKKVDIRAKEEADASD
jgi:hypothetical protein